MCDNYCCMLTSTSDRTSVSHGPKLDRQHCYPKAILTTIKACHIMNELTMQGVGPTKGSKESTVKDKVCACCYAPHSPSPTSLSKQNILSTSWAFSGTLDLRLLPKNFSRQMASMTPGICCHQNNAHTCFNRLELWFKGTNG